MVKSYQRLMLDPPAPCDQCGSLFHQLGGHPNPNHPSGFLRGCFFCNTTKHSAAQCTRLKKGKKAKLIARYFRQCRDGLAPGEDECDPREIAIDGHYTTRKYMPRRPDFAIANPYQNEKDFRAPCQTNPTPIIRDPFFESEYAWVDLGMYIFTKARTTAEAVEDYWLGQEGRHDRIYEDLAQQLEAEVENAPTEDQLENFSSYDGERKPRTRTGFFEKIERKVGARNDTSRSIKIEPDLSDTLRLLPEGRFLVDQPILNGPNIGVHGSAVSSPSQWGKGIHYEGEARDDRRQRQELIDQRRELHRRARIDGKQHLSAHKLFLQTQLAQDGFHEVNRSEASTNLSKFYHSHSQAIDEQIVSAHIETSDRGDSKGYSCIRDPGYRRADATDQQLVQHTYAAESHDRSRKHKKHRVEPYPSDASAAREFRRRKLNSGLHGRDLEEDQQVRKLRATYYRLDQDAYARAANIEVGLEVDRQAVARQHQIRDEKEHRGNHFASKAGYHLHDVKRPIQERLQRLGLADVDMLASWDGDIDPDCEGVFDEQVDLMDREFRPTFQEPLPNNDAELFTSGSYASRESQQPKRYNDAQINKCYDGGKDSGKFRQYCSSGQQPRMQEPRRSTSDSSASYQDEQVRFSRYQNYEDPREQYYTYDRED